METHERIKFIRNDMKLSQEAFGKTIGVSRDVVANLEQGRVKIQDSMLRLICKTHLINYFWLTEGLGEPYINVPNIIMDDAIEKFKLDQEDKAIIEEYVKLDVATREVFKNYLRSIFKKTPG